MINFFFRSVRFSVKILFRFLSIWISCNFCEVDIFIVTIICHMVSSTAVEATCIHFVFSVCDKLRNAPLDLLMMIDADDFSMQKGKEIYTRNYTCGVL